MPLEYFASDKMEKKDNSDKPFLPVEFAIISVPPLLLLLEDLDDLSFFFGDLVLLGGGHTSAEGLAALPAVL